MQKPRIRHIALNVRDREAVAAHYKTVFGFEEKARGSKAQYTCQMDSLMSR
jgi:catechol-2,3-dioxygenase